MNNHILFAFEFFKNPIANASIIPSSRFLSEKMIEDIDFQNIRCIVELGPGTGCFTKHIVEKANKDCKIITIELNDCYANLLKTKYKDKIKVENCSAHLLDELLKKHNIEKVDLIVSGLGFVTLPNSITKPLLNKINQHTKNGTIFRTFTYRPKKFEEIFSGMNIKRKSFTPLNLPPAHVYGIN
ncbi:MAG: rRNA adenine N-6-methyltransferase family protein [Candidatus Absconditabacteria bacterium]